MRARETGKGVGGVGRRERSEGKVRRVEGAPGVEGGGMERGQWTEEVGGVRGVREDAVGRRDSRGMRSGVAAISW